MRKALCAALVVLTLLAQAQEKRPGEVVTTIDVDILSLDILAVDKKGQPVFDLKPEELEVRIGGRVQPLEGFEPPPRPEGIEVGAPSKDAPTSETRPATANPLHVVLFFDLEDLSTDGIVTAVETAKEWARVPSGAPRVSVVSYYGGAGVLIWDEAGTERVESVLDTLLEESRENRVDNRASWVEGRTGGHSGGGPAAVPRDWDARRREEARLVRNIVENLHSGRMPTASYDEFGDYLQGERERVREVVEGIRDVASRLALLTGRRHLVLVTQGLERVPGRNAVEFLKRAMANYGKSMRTMDLSQSRTPFDMNDVTANYRFNASRLRELDELEPFLAASGVVTHFVAPSVAFAMASADQSPIESLRDRISDSHAMREGVERVVLATGGQTRLHGAGGLGKLIDVAGATYRVAVRMTGVQTGRNYKVQVSSKRPGVTVTSRSAYQPKPPASQAPLLAQAAQAAGAEERREERRPGAARRGKSMPVTLRWKGKTGTTSTPPKKRYALDVAIPTDSVHFVPEADAMVASLKIGIQARDLDKPGVEESLTEDAFLALTGEEYSAAAGKETVRRVTLHLAPGRWELAVTVRDELENAFGSATERVTAEE